MKVKVTHLKAPWPAGTVPGHIVEFAGLDKAPAWTAGKCEPAEDDAEAASVVECSVAPAELPAAAAPAGELVVNPDAEAEARAAEALAAAEAQHQAEVAAAAEREAGKGKGKAKA